MERFPLTYHSPLEIPILVWIPRDSVSFAPPGSFAPLARPSNPLNWRLLWKEKQNRAMRIPEFVYDAFVESRLIPNRDRDAAALRDSRGLKEKESEREEVKDR